MPKSKHPRKKAKNQEARPRGRPPTRSMPEFDIQDTPENIAYLLTNTPPKPDEEWDYMKAYRQREQVMEGESAPE